MGRPRGGAGVAGLASGYDSFCLGYCDRRRYPEPMPDDHDKPATPTPTGEPFGHLTLRDTRTPEEKAEAQRKENARRKGRGRKDWWKDCPPKR